MKIFMTGATGYIGNAVARCLKRTGHEVTALVRNPGKAEDLAEYGVKLVQGDLAGIMDHLPEIEEHRVYIHIAAALKEGPPLDELAIRAFTHSRENRHFIYTSGVWVLGNTGPGVADEAAPPNPIRLVAWRAEHEKWVLDAGRDDFATTVLRPGCVYGWGQSLLRPWFEAAEKGEPIQVVGQGNNHWAMVHLDELADAYRLATEKRSRGVLHAVDGTRSTLRECAAAVAAGGGKGSAVQTTPIDEARKKLGPFADALAIDQRVAANSTSHRLEWNPRKTFLKTVEEQWKEWGKSRG